MNQPQPAQTTNSAPTLDAEVVIEDDRWRLLLNIEKAVLAAAACVLKIEDLRSLEGASAITIVLVNDERIAALNAQFRDKATPTNVLSFPTDRRATEPGAPTYLGDVIIALETVQREAREQNVPVLHHVQHLTVHGILHLLGYDHLTNVDAEAMETQEIQLLASLGIADPYASQ